MEDELKRLTENQELEHYADQFEDFLVATQSARLLSQKCRDYKDHKQWTDEEVAVLESRGQAAIVYNYLADKVKALLGLESQRQTDPKAFPRTPQHEQDAEAVTDSIRYVIDNNNFQDISSQVLDNTITEAYGGCAIDVEFKRNKFEVKVTQIPFDRYYYDPHSRRLDFKDAAYMGIVVWMELQDAKNLFPSKSKDLDSLLDSNNEVGLGEDFEDKPLGWIDRGDNRKRVRILEHYFLVDNEWHVTFFTRGLFLIQPQKVPYMDEDGAPECPIEANTGYITRDNERYSEMRGLLDAQDEVNKRRSKALHNINSRQTFGNTTAVPDVQKAKEEMAKPDGHIELGGVAQFGKDFGIIPTGDMLAGQLEMYEDAKARIDASSINPALTGSDEKTISGRAIQARQQGGLTEIEYIFASHRGWKLRVYRQIWNRIRQYWDKERWIRVTDDERNVRFVALNQSLTKGDALREITENRKDPRYEQALTMLEQAEGHPALEEPHKVKNNLAELDVDIIIDDGPDVVTIQQEQFSELLDLAKIYGPEAVPFESIVELSGLRNKQKFLDKTKGEELTEEQQEMQEIQKELQLKGAVAEVEEKEGSARESHANADKTEVETRLLLTQPQHDDAGLTGKSGRRTSGDRKYL